MRFPNFNDDWTQIRLGELLSFETGYPFSSDEFNEDGEGVRLIKNRDLKADDRIVFYKGDYDDQYLVQNGNILIGMDGDFTPCLWKKGKALLNQRVGRININGDTSRVFIFYLLADFLKEIEIKTSSTTVKHLSHREVEQIKAYLPLLAEQKKIADFLSLIDERITNLSETIKERKREKAGLLNQLFSQKLRFPDFDDEWTQTTLGEIAEITSGYSGEQEQTETPYRVSRIETISSGVIDIDRVGFVPYDARLEEYKLSLGDILFSNINSIEHIGKSAIVRKPVDLYHGMNLLRLKAINIDPYALYYHLQRDVVRNRFRSIANKAVSQASINQTTLGKEVILFAPSLSEQKKIADFLSLIDERIEVEEQLLKKYEEQKKYLLRQMFV